MAPLWRRPCLYVEGGCTWQTTKFYQIATITEGVGAHSCKCTFNPPVQHRRRQEEANEARRVAEEEATKARWIAAKKAAEERRRERDYRRQREAQEAKACDLWRQGDAAWRAYRTTMSKPVKPQR
jgi:hypothetical protein